MNLCSIKGCSLPCRKKGMCNSHYNKEWRESKKEHVKNYEFKRQKIKRVKKYFKYHNDKDYRLSQLNKAKTYREEHSDKVKESKEKFKSKNKELIKIENWIYDNTKRIKR